MHNNSKWGRWVVAVLALGVMGVVLVGVFKDNLRSGEVQKVEGYEPWQKETVELFEALPVQDGGRVKPFATFAGFRMLGVHGSRSMKVEGKDGKVYKLKPTEWLMDSVFRPELAVNLPTFRIDNSKVLEAIGMDQKGRRDRYSYNEIVEGRDKLVELAQSYEITEKNERDPVQQQTIDLAYNIRNYEALLSYFSFARYGISLQGSGETGVADKRVDFSSVMTTAPEIRSQIALTQKQGGEIDERLQILLQQMLDGANFAKFGLFILPPESASKQDWLSAGNAIMEVMTVESTDPKTAISDIKALETAVRSLQEGEGEFREGFGKFINMAEKRAESRGELSYVAAEVDYFKKDYFMNALVLFLIGTLSALAMWGLSSAKQKEKFEWSKVKLSKAGAGYLLVHLRRNFFYLVTLGSTLAGTALCVIAIVVRCIIMQRPPVGNLYDTIIFICTTAIIFSLLIEWMSRKTFALGLSPILGVTLIYMARRYEIGDAADHLDPLVAVLDSNFWLATHVTTITLGYSAGLLATMLSCIYVLMRGLNLDGNNKELRRSLSHAVYGSICLTLFLSLVGTVLGGIWANYSWGRFWGWDPKENGALMIVLWTLAILHARIGGIIKEWGLHLASMFTACIVVFSWWHVNFLGVGLHSYGFTAGKGTIWLFYSVMLAFMFFGVTVMLIEKYGKLNPSAKKQEEVKGLEA